MDWFLYDRAFVMKELKITLDLQGIEFCESFERIQGSFLTHENNCGITDIKNKEVRSYGF